VDLGVVCVAAGRGRRFGGDKLASTLGGRPVLAVAVEALRRAFPQAPLAVVLPPGRVEHWRSRVLEAAEDAILVEGGELRQDSVRGGVEAVAARGAKLALVHDAARPLLDPVDARRLVEALGDADGAILARRIPDTVKRVDGQGWVRATVPRDDLWLALTPQVFSVASLREGWRSQAPDAVWTDEAALLEASGRAVRVVEARRLSPKLTTADDLELLRTMLEVRR